MADVDKVKHDPSPAKMIITVEGGLIQAIDGGPLDLDIEVWDFDANDELAVENEAGERFWQAEWRTRGEGEPGQLRKTCPYPQTEDEYVESSMDRGAHCPNCGAWDLSYKSPDMEAAAVYQDATCRCGFDFYDKYHLAGYEEAS